MRILEVIYNGFHKALLSPASCPASAKPKSKKAARTRARCKFQRMFGIWNAQLGATAASQMAIATRNKTSVAQKRLMWVKQCHVYHPPVITINNRWYGYLSQSWLVYCCFTTVLPLRCLVLDPRCHGAMVPLGVSTWIYRRHLRASHVQLRSRKA